MSPLQANTSVLLWGRGSEGRLFALWEAGAPHEIDPRTLETQGPSDFHGMVRQVGWQLASLSAGAEA